MLKMPIKTVVSLRIWDSPYAFLSESVAIGAQGSQRSSVQKQRAVCNALSIRVWT